ncbi:LysR substrate-binding domain-containing protein [Paracoccus sp. PARArs4]|uniref:LysR substrate-binding domain-containing protein n=1 Tax=Paracoccus sp. PARArs4 TaxID=2853442 RepID=UPI0024A6BC9B|nr:LysR substrate-binding domain-containing protein [Paracoccus sp. PARArs4]
MRKLPHVTWLRAFEAAARHASFSAAADELGLTAAAVSQQIRLLEGHLGIQLFRRLARGVELTDMGQAYAVPVRKSFAEMQVATDGLFSDRRSSVIRVRSSISYAALVLARRLAAFRNEHPGIEIELSTAVWADRMNGASIDLDIRYGAGDWPEQNIHPLKTAPATVVCHPDYAPAIPDLNALARADIVQIVGCETDWDRLFLQEGMPLPRPVHWMRADSSLLALQMLSAGHGCAIVSRSFAFDAFEAGTLVAPLPVEVPMSQSFYVVEQDDLGPREDVAIFVDWLRGLSF